MDYTINKLAKMAGITTRTLRHYDEIGLLSPTRKSSNGYRIYGTSEVDRLQHILFYRELGLSLIDIKKIVTDENFDPDSALHNHLIVLQAKRVQLDLLIANVENTIIANKGDRKMNDKDKFDGFGNKLVAQNEEQFGAEIREKYGDSVVDSSNRKIEKMTKDTYDEIQALSNEINTKLKIAFETGDPSSDAAQEVCELHRKWLCYYYDDYSKEYHLGVAEMYVADERFAAYYDKIEIGCAEFLRNAINLYCQ